MLHYIIQTVVFQLLFLLTYDLFLKKETFFNINRLYLLVTPILSLLIPLIKIDSVQQALPEAYTMTLPTIFLGEATGQTAPQSVQAFDWSWLAYAGMVISLLFFAFRLYKIWRLKKTGELYTFPNFKQVVVKEKELAFSFFDHIFLGAATFKKDHDHIIQHEMIHVKQKHSYDLLFFELLRIVFWFNPMIYVYQKRISELHEFIADSVMTKSVKKKQYCEHLLQEVFQTQNISFINQFFNHSLIKKRIVMLQKSKSKQIFKLKYLLLLPLVMVMMVYTSCTQEAIAQQEETVVEGKSTAAAKSDVMAKIEELRESIAAKGNMTEEEEKALTALFVLINKDGLESQYVDWVKDELDIPFGVIEEVPVFPGCEDATDKKKCFEQNISAFVGKNFDVKMASGLGLEGKQRIMVQFRIKADGTVSKIKARAPHPKLEDEATRVVSILPTMEPGKAKGKKVSVIYSLPIVFALE